MKEEVKRLKEQIVAADKAIQEISASATQLEKEKSEVCVCVCVCPHLVIHSKLMCHRSHRTT